MPVVKVRNDNGVWEDVAGASGHTHNISDITNFPLSMPANGGNAETLGGMRASEFVTIDRLWENASPSSNFGAQTVNVNANGYDQFCIEFRRSTTAYLYTSVTFPVGGGSSMSLYFGDAGFGAHRDILGSDVNSIVFNGATYNGQKNQNSNLIPYAIYGIKGVY